MHKSAATTMAIFLALVTTTPVPAAAPEQDQTLQACLGLAATDPAGAEAKARLWDDHGSGLARLCQAMAAFHGGRFASAGQALEELAPRLGKGDPKTAANLLDRAAWAWLRAGDAERADKLYGQALAEQPDDIELLIDRAFARVEAKRPKDAVADLSAAIKRDASRPEAYLYRAGAYQALREFGHAEQDLARALTLRPNFPEALLMSGNLKARRNDLAGAVGDWTRLAKLAPESPSGKVALNNLERLKAATQAPAAKPAAKPAAPAPSK
ncbi:MAG: hypothetical protein GC191_10290 [Azospirillum sp.]|nr:hypothetical protein [Azospirillum sp.]